MFRAKKLNLKYRYIACSFSPSAIANVFLYSHVAWHGLADGLIGKIMGQRDRVIKVRDGDGVGGKREVIAADARKRAHRQHVLV